MESKKVSVDDGFTAIPNALLDAILEGDFTKNQIKLILGVIRKTTSWHKEMDWVCNEQLAELCRLCDKFEASRVKNQLIKMNVLVQDGRKIGVNLFISEWINGDCINSQHCEKHTQENVKTHNQDCINSQPQKETITKYKINNTPLPPRESANAEQQAIGSAENIEPKKSKNLPVDYQGVMEEFNLAVADTPISQIRVMSDQRKRAVHALAKLIKKQFGCYTRKAFGDYFQDFVSQVNTRADRFYFGGQDGSRWKADFDYLMKAKTFAKTVEGSL